MATEFEIVRELSDRLVTAQKPIRILDSIKWDDEVKAEFFKSKFKKLPPVNKEYYLEKSPLKFDVDSLILELRTIVRDSQRLLGQYTPITQLLRQRCDEYCRALMMLTHRGTPKFSEIAMELYGGPDDAFYPNGPKLSELGTILFSVLDELSVELYSDRDEKKYDAVEAMEILSKRLGDFFTDRTSTVELSDNILADAAAGADKIKMNSKVKFSERDLRYLEVHEGWVHVGTTLNGNEQPYCTFLGKGSPSSTVTQEGLAVITEVFSFCSSPTRILKLSHRVNAIAQANQGANFIDIFKFYREKNYTEDESYSYASRIFRGSAPELGPFTKDLSYTKGFVLIYNFIRLAVKKGLINHIPLLFVGKTNIDEISILNQLKEEGLVTAPKYLPPQFQDLSAITAWMSLSLYLNKFDLEKLAKNYNF